MLEMIRIFFKVQSHYSSTVNHNQSVGINAQYSLIANCSEIASL